MSDVSVHQREESTRPEDASACDVSVVIVSYNVCDFLEQALRAVDRATEGLTAEVFVVDNDSRDGSAAMVRSAFPGVHLIENDANVGFSRANNQAIRRARGRYVLLLNPDTLVEPNTLGVLAGFLDDHPEAGAVGGQIRGPDGTFAPESRRAFPTPMVALYRMLGLSRLFPNSRRFARYNLSFLPRDEVAEVDALSGACMMVRRAALRFSQQAWKRENGSAQERVNGSAGERGKGRKDERKREKEQSAPANPELITRDAPTRQRANRSGAGLLDEDFFMYGEDLDWCYRIQQAGWKIYYTPETQITHFKGESTRRGDREYVRLFYRAMLQFVDKHFAERYDPLFVRFLKAGIRVRAALGMGRRWLRDLLR